MPGDRARGNGHKLTALTVGEFSGFQTLAQVAQGGRGVSVLGNVQKLSGCGLGQLAVGDLA